MSSVKFTICLPSFGRLSNLVSTLTSLSSVSKRNDTEIVVSLNQYSHDIETRLRSRFSTGNYIFCSTPSQYDMPTNFDYALSMSSGQYITFIGNDDALMPDAIDTAIDHFGIHPKSVLSWYRWPYYWNSYAPLSNQLFVHRKCGNICVNTDVAVEDMLHRYPDFSVLPCVYNSFFPRHIIDLMRQYPYRNQSLNGWPRLWPKNKVLSLDVFNAFQALAFIDDYYFSPYPLTLSGISGKGGGMAYDPTDSINKSFADPRITLSGSQSVLLATDLLTVSELYYQDHPLLSRLTLHAIRKGAFFRYLTVEHDKYPELLSDFEQISHEVNQQVATKNFFGEKRNLIPMLPERLMPDLKRNLRVVEVSQFGVKTCGDAAELYPELAGKLFAN